MTPPAVSVILPTFNRARFIPEALESIQSQQWPSMELIVVDDGSTDGTRDLIERVGDRFTHPIRYIFQENSGAYAARNTGLEHAQGDFIAFYDSDDLWYPHHLERLAAALTRHPDVAWAYAACRSVEQSSGRELAASTFLIDGRPRPFLNLHATTDEQGFHVIDDTGVLACQIEHGLYAGLQNSLIRRSVFEGERFWPGYRVVEDVLFLARRLAAGMRLGYYEDVQVVYRVHQGNSSASAHGGSTEHMLAIYEEQVRGFEAIRRSTQLQPADARALRRRLAHVAFWHLGYSGYLQRGDTPSARRAFRRAIREWPWSPGMWKTWLGMEVRQALGATHHR